ncbi:MAG: polyprenyl synthetase family protein [Chloroflexi bacterium]|nr:polyprenyl synthetase family protein [Chloroflexota bacterium]
MSSTTSIAAIYEPIAAELEEVKRRLKGAAQASFGPLSSMLDKVLVTDGKRVRPALTLLASRFHTPPEPDNPVLMACAVELLHIATLIHDDTIDNSRVRRGRPTLSSLFGQHTAVLVGDYLFAKSATLVCDTKNVRAIRLFAEAIMHLSTGELQETHDAFNWRQDREHYFQRIFRKTSSLFQTAAETGAILSGAPEETVQAARAFGYNLGQAFQIVDDIIDFQGEANEVGKPVGSDLLQGTVTLPFIMLLERTPLAELGLNDGQRDPEQLRKLIDRIRNSGLIREAYAVANGFLDSARAAAMRLPATPARRSLLGLTDYVVERRK